MQVVVRISHPDDGLRWHTPVMVKNDDKAPAMVKRCRNVRIERGCRAAVFSIDRTA